MKIVLLLLMVVGLYANPPKTLSADIINVKIDGYSFTVPLFVMCIEKTKWLVKGYSDTSPVQMMEKSHDELSGDTIMLPKECN